MSLTSEEIRQMVTAGINAEQLLVIASIVEERSKAADLAKKKERDRKRRFRLKGRDRDGTETDAAGDRDGTPPLDVPLSLPLSPAPLTSSLSPLNPPKLKKKRARNVPLEEVTIDRNRDWLAKKRTEGRYLNHDEAFILEYFVNYCRSKGKIYDDHLSAYRNAFEWDACQPKPTASHFHKPNQNNGKQTFKSERERLADKYRQDAEREEQAAASGDFGANMRPAESIR